MAAALIFASVSVEDFRSATDVAVLLDWLDEDHRDELTAVDMEC